MLSRLKFDISVLVSEIIDQLPESVWTSTTTTFLDPALGGGQFVAIIEQRLRNAGHSDENIASRVFGYEDNQIRINFAVNKYKLKGTYVTGKFLEEKIDMEFDVIVGNPPYQGKAELHQKFFNKGVELLKDGGTIAFIQPATPYFNKKESIRTNAQAMIDNVQAFQSTVNIISGKVFANANIFTSLAVTTLNKIPNPSNTLVKYVSESGDEYFDVNIDSVNMLQMDLSVYTSLVAKVFKIIDLNDSIQSLITTDTEVPKLYVQKVRGNIGKHDFYSLVSNKSSYWEVKKEFDYGLAITAGTDTKSLLSYLTSFVARFCLAIYKFNGNNHMGELRSVPQVPFDRIWNDKMLCDYFGITDAEYTEILRCIPDYYGLGDNLA